MKDLQKISLISLLIVLVMNQVQYQGEYSLIQSSLGMANYQNITIKITDRYISIRGGCNTQTGYFNVNSIGKVTIGPFLSTKTACIPNNDDLFVKSLATVVKFDITPSGILSLYDTSGKVISKYTLITDPAANSNSMSNLTTANQSSQGQMVTNQGQNPVNNGGSVNLAQSTVNENSLYFGQNYSGSHSQGVSTQNISQLSSQSYSQPSDQQAGSSLPLSQILLTPNIPQELPATFSQQTITLPPTLKQSTISSINVTQSSSLFQTSQSNSIIFDGIYKTNLPANPNIRVTFINDSVSLTGGCNINRANYNATSDGNIQFNAFVSTRMYCVQDVDFLYTNALSISTKFAIQGANIALFEFNGQVPTIVLSPFYDNSNLTPSIDITKNTSPNGNNQNFLTNTPQNTTSQNATTLENYLNPSTSNISISTPKVIPIYFNGNYSTSITAIPNEIISFIQDQVSVLNGCNTYFSTYYAFSNGSITFGNFAGTKKACINDIDYIYLNALADGYTFIQDNLNNSIHIYDYYGVETIILAKAGLGISEGSSSPSSTSTSSSTNSNGGYTQSTGSNGGYTQSTSSNGYIQSTGSNVGYNQSTGSNGGYTQSTGSNGYTQSTGSNGGYTQSTGSNVGYTQSTGSNGGYTQSTSSNGYTQSTGSNVGYIQSTGSNGGYTQSTSSNGYTQSTGSNVGYTQSTGSNGGYTQSTGSNGGYTQSTSSNGYTQSTGSNVGYTQSTGSNGYTQSTSSNGYTQSTSSNGYTQSTGSNLAATVSTTLNVNFVQSPLALYNLTPSFVIFEGFQVVLPNDSYIQQITTFLLQNFPYFLNDNTILAAMKRYCRNSIDYQVIMKTNFGNFNAYIEYNPSQLMTIFLKFLAIVDFNELEISYFGCGTQDYVNRNCKNCSSGYQNFKGRCFYIDKNCIQYTGDQCTKCENGPTVQGSCQQ